MESTKFTHDVEESVLPKVRRSSTALNAVEQLVEMI